MRGALVEIALLGTAFATALAVLTIPLPPLLAGPAVLVLYALTPAPKILSLVTPDRDIGAWLAALGVSFLLSTLVSLVISQVVGAVNPLGIALAPVLVRLASVPFSGHSFRSRLPRPVRGSTIVAAITAGAVGVLITHLQLPTTSISPINGTRLVVRETGTITTVQVVSGERGSARFRLEIAGPAGSQPLAESFALAPGESSVHSVADDIAECCGDPAVLRLYLLNESEHYREVELSSRGG